MAGTGRNSSAASEAGRALVNVRWRRARGADGKAAAAAATGALTLDDARARVARLQGDRLELLTAQMRAELIPAAEVESIVGAVCDVVRTKLCALPSSVAPRVAAATELSEIQRVLNEAIFDALTELSERDIVAAIKRRARALGGGIADGEAPGAEVTAAADADAE